jgi:hypothetical protein
VGIACLLSLHVIIQMAGSQDILHPRRVQEFLAFCPTGVSTYVSLHLDSIGKILNHILLIMAVLNSFLFLNSWNVSFLPNIGFSTTFVSLMLCFQNACVWIIINNHRISSFSFMRATDFMVGVALGITMGGTVLAFVVSSNYRHVSRCDTMQQDPTFEYLCGNRKSSLVFVWFWSGLIFWLNFCSTLLIAIGREELAHSGQYEDVSMNDYEDHFRRFQQLSQEAGVVHSSPAPAFVGDYTSVPEVRTDGDSVTSSMASVSLGTKQSEEQRSENARIYSV